MDDAELVRAARSGDLAAFTAIFDRHAARVHDLALAMLRDRSAALEVVESTFLEASLRLHGLQEDHRLPVWLLAVTRRNGALRAGPTAGVDRQPTLPNDDPERVHLASLVWEATADLPLRDRTLLDLDLRQGLDGHDLADALGVTLTQAQDLQARMRDRIEKSLSGYLIARTADGRCPDLTKVLKGWDGRFAPKDSRRIAKHVEGCRICNQTRFALPSPFALYAVGLPAPFPAAARSRVIDRVVLPSAPNAAPGIPPSVPGPALADSAPYQAPLPATSAYQPANQDAAASPFQEAPPVPYPEATAYPEPYPAQPYPEGAQGYDPYPAALPQPEAPQGYDPYPAAQPYPEAAQGYDPHAAAQPYPEAPGSDPYPAQPSPEAGQANPYTGAAPSAEAAQGYDPYPTALPQPGAPQGYDPYPAAEPTGGYDPSPAAEPHHDAPQGYDPYPTAAPEPAQGYDPYPAANPYPPAPEDVVTEAAAHPLAPAPHPEALDPYPPADASPGAEADAGAVPHPGAGPSTGAAAEPEDGRTPATGDPEEPAADPEPQPAAAMPAPPPPRPQEL